MENSPVCLRIEAATQAFQDSAPIKKNLGVNKNIAKESIATQNKLPNQIILIKHPIIYRPFYGQIESK